jgi:hypothetical protein
MTEIEIKHEHAADPMTRRVGVLVGVVGVLLSVVTISSHRAHTGAVIHRTESNDQWGFYQAKKIRQNLDEDTLVLLKGLNGDTSHAEAATKKLEAAIEKHARETDGIQEEAKRLEHETEHEEHRALRFDIGEGLLELGLVLLSLFFLARKPFFPIFGIIASVAGIIIGTWGWLL